jgi:hypothetical protein
VKQRVEPKDVELIASQAKAAVRPGEAERPILVAPYLSPRTQALLAESGISYVTSGSLSYELSGGTLDTGAPSLSHTGGTISLQLANPATFIDVKGKERDLWTASRDQPLSTLRGPITGRVIRALCDFRPPYGVQELAERSSTPIASVSRALGLLDREALVTRSPGGAVIDVQWAELIHRWTQDYSFGKANTVATYLEPRGLPALLNKLRQTEQRYTITSSQAASLLAPVAAPRLLSIYVERLDEAASSWGLRQAERGANVILAEPFNPVVFDRTQVHDAVTYAAPSQVAADLLTGPGRSPAEGEALLQWMKDNEHAWRS